MKAAIFALAVLALLGTQSSTIEGCSDGFCTADVAPVCGSDKTTYSNRCELNCAIRTNPSISYLYDGECKTSYSWSSTCGNISPYYDTYINNALSNKCPDGRTAQGASAVHSLCKVTSTASWQGSYPVTLNCGIIPLYTPIATFTGQGRTYDKVNDQAGIFLGCLSGGAIRVADQWCGHAFNERVIYKTCLPGAHNDCSDNYWTFIY